MIEPGTALPLRQSTYISSAELDEAMPQVAANVSENYAAPLRTPKWCAEGANQNVSNGVE